MDVRIIEVPYHAGDDTHPSAGGPGDLVRSGAAEAVGAEHDVTVETVDRAETFRDSASSSASVNRRLSTSVRAASSDRRFPLVLAGSCTAAHGVVAGMDRSTTGVIWIDAHADFNTPDTTVSGFFPGMSLAVLAGDCYRDYYAALGGAPVAQEAIALFGVRELSPVAERERLERSAIHSVSWAGGVPTDDVGAILDDVAQRASDVYLHIDMDAFAPEIAPGVADDPVPGGLSFEDAERIIRGTAATLHITAATLATYNPLGDVEGRTRSLALRLLGVIGDCLAMP